ncbi:MAG TPA: choice-of-anchor Q domain-containing protein [Rhodanobacteraceae bacterium]|nr:choice-of-anchor Q domain-containing protein [Rhodanobacteraceae bacterium]
MPLCSIRLLVALALCLGSTAAGAATYTVTRGDDPAPDGCLAADCSLREAIEATAATPEADTILLGAGQYQVTRGELAIDRAITIAGAGSAATQLTSAGNYTILHVVSFGAVTVEGMEIGSVDGEALTVADGGTATLRDIRVPANTGGVGTDSPPGDTGTGSIRLEHSTIESYFACLQPQGTCRAFDSRVHQVLVSGSELELVRVEVDGENTDFYGVSIASASAVTIEDSTIRRTRRPLYLLGDGASAERVNIRRTRFIDNTGPLVGDRASIVDMDEVEFRGHVVADANAGDPAVLLALPGPTWFVSRALVVGNRGGADLDGAVVRVLGGGRVVFDNSTFDDNTFRAGASYGHTIGVYNATGDPTVLWLLHVTMRRAASLDDATVGSLLTVRGPAVDARVANSALRGTCGFGGGGAITQGVGNAESIGDTCGLDPATNEVEMPSFDMSLGSLDDHGGFTETFAPTRNSLLIDAADAAFCALIGDLDQRRFARPVDGVACDIGALEVGAIADAIFEDAFDG